MRQRKRPSPPHCYAYARAYNGERKTIAINFTAQPMTIEIGAGKGRVELSTFMDRQGVVDLAAVELRPFEGIILVG
jgi:hypothetical protein